MREKHQDPTHPNFLLSLDYVDNLKTVNDNEICIYLKE